MIRFAADNLGVERCLAVKDDRKTQLEKLSSVLYHELYLHDACPFISELLQDSSASPRQYAWGFNAADPLLVRSYPDACLGTHGHWLMQVKFLK